MVTRREAIFAAATLLSVPTDSLAGGLTGQTSTRPSVVGERVDFAVPPGSCDSHVHVIGDPRKFPLWPSRPYTPPPATAAELAKMLSRLTLDRVVIVTPDVYGTDNSATVNAIKQLGKDRARGVVWLPRDPDPSSLDAMAEEGIRGIRESLPPHRPFDVSAVSERLARRFTLAAAHQWLIEIAAPPEVVAALAEPLSSAPTPIVFDYFGWAEGGVAQPGFQVLLSLVRSGRAYVKLSEPYRLSKLAPNYPDLAPVARAFVEANPDRVVWGSGWPHLAGLAPGKTWRQISPNLAVDDVHLLDALAVWVPDPALRHKILVENPARLFGF